MKNTPLQIPQAQSLHRLESSTDSLFLDSTKQLNQMPDSKFQTFTQYLDSKGIEYAPFDKERMPKIFASIKSHIVFPKHIIRILGTNGKGSTGRFITLGLMQQGFSVLHFSSPHLFCFNERFYKNGAHVSDEALQKAHTFLQQFTITKQASYFEYTTLLALVLAQDCTYFVCEAGLGGEFDSTNILQTMTQISVFTPISYDHQEMLGDTIESIATTKLKAMSSYNLIAPQRFTQTITIAQEIAHKRNAQLFYITHDETESILLCPSMNAYAANFAPFLRQNLAVAQKVLESLQIQVDYAHLAPFDLPARAQWIAPNILLDVGHNADGARCILKIIGAKRVYLVYNTFLEKDVRSILDILKPIIDKLLIIPVTHPRILPKADLIRTCEDLGIEYEDFTQIQDKSEYVVFGSFSVIETFWRIWNARQTRDFHC